MLRSTNTQRNKIIINLSLRDLHLDLEKEAGKKCGGTEGGTDRAGQKKGREKNIVFFYHWFRDLSWETYIKSLQPVYYGHLSFNNEMHSQKMSLHDFCFYVNITVYLHKPI